ncbi:hypothetical protein [Rhodobacteraceae phage LS06-2018-MD07]|jgi:hypothetical protein|nr:hypothetical protein [Rhodobacteraceae phage LS06-2018-MD07]
MNWDIKRVSPVCHDLETTYERNEDWRAWMYLGADGHLDNPHTRLDLKRKHMNLAKKRGAAMCEFGDVMDLMQGKGDRRQDKALLRDELRRSDYLNGVVEFAYDFFEPYLENMVYIGKGNHETASTHRYEFDPLSALTFAMRKGGSPVQLAGYRGYIRVRFRRPEGGGTNTIIIHQNHGSGGGGAVTRGVIQTNRDAVWMNSPDIVVGGHIHEAWHVEVPQAILLRNGKEVMKIQHHIRIPTYKDEFSNQADGYHVENGRAPKPLGAWWLEFRYIREDDRIVVNPVRTVQ